MRHVPNIITSLNLASGFIAVIFAAGGNPLAASWLILAAMIFDFFDGFSARILKAYSEIGRELDSLADVVSFGVAPAMILSGYIKASLAVNDPGLTGTSAALIIYAPAIMPVCAALRLARFNIDPSQAVTFKGLPTPANAIAVISVVIAESFSEMPILKSFTNSSTAILVYTAILSLLMVTNIPLLSNKMKSLKLRGNEGRYILVGFVIISFALLGFASVLLIIPFYILSSFLDRIFFKPE